MGTYSSNTTIKVVSSGQAQHAGNTVLFSTAANQYAIVSYCANATGATASDASITVNDKVVASARQSGNYPVVANGTFYVGPSSSVKAYQGYALIDNTPFPPITSYQGYVNIHWTIFQNTP